MCKLLTGDCPLLFFVRKERSISSQSPMGTESITRLYGGGYLRFQFSTIVYRPQRSATDCHCCRPKSNSSGHRKPQIPNTLMEDNLNAFCGQDQASSSVASSSTRLPPFIVATSPRAALAVAMAALAASLLCVKISIFAWFHHSRRNSSISARSSS
jgi:hypothetical protein